MSIAPFIAIYPQPIPLYITVGLSALLFFWTFLLPEAGKYAMRVQSENQIVQTQEGEQLNTKMNAELTVIPDLRGSAISG